MCRVIPHGSHRHRRPSGKLEFRINKICFIIDSTGNHYVYSQLENHFVIRRIKVYRMRIEKKVWAIDWIDATWNQWATWHGMGMAQVTLCIHTHMTQQIEQRFQNYDRIIDFQVLAICVCNNNIILFIVMEVPGWCWSNNRRINGIR